MAIAPRSVELNGETRVLLAMRWELVRRGIAEMLRDLSESVLGFKASVVGETGDADEVFTLARDLKPEVIIGRANLLGLDIHDFNARLEEACGTRVPLIILSREMGHARVLEACATGVAAYLPAEVSPITLAAALLSVRSGNLLLCNEARDILLEEIRHRSSNRVSNPAVLEGLTARERDVIALVAEGLSNKEIAFRLGIGRRTAEMHVARLIDKFGMASRSELLVELLS